jgi:hypothetical protein
MVWIPASSEQVTAETFRIEPDRSKLKATRRHEGQYLLRGNLTGDDLAELWHHYIHLVRIEAPVFIKLPCLLPARHP